MYATIDVRQPISDVVAAASNAEDLLEEAGVDYWFGWNQPLRAVCESAHVDPETIAFRLMARDTGVRDLGREGLVSLFSTVDQHFELRLQPALVRARRAAETLDDLAARSTAAAVLEGIDRVTHGHMESVRQMSPFAAALDIGADVTIDSQTVRHLTLDHNTLAMCAQDLRVLAEQGDGEFADAARALTREIHQHIKIAYNFILPRLVAATSDPTPRLSGSRPR